MARRATKDTFGIERIPAGKDGDDDIEIRRKVVAGQEVPLGIEVDASALEETEDPENTGPTYRQHQILGTKESDKVLKDGVYGTAEDVSPNDEPKSKGKARPTKSGATEAADDHNQARGDNRT